MLYQFGDFPRALLRVIDDFGFKSYDLVGYPRRLCEFLDEPSLAETNVDRRRAKELPSPARVFLDLLDTNSDSWLSVSNRTMSMLYATFLITEDPQRRLDARKAATLMHQVSLVQHILNKPNLRKVLIGDEVGLGKTIEAGLLVQQLIERNSRIRVLYLAPAKLVPNVIGEFRNKLSIDARSWVAGSMSDARLSEDRVVVASINKAVFGDNFQKVLDSGPWDVLIVDECHHLSDWDPSGGKPNQAFRLVSQLAKKLPTDGRLVLMSGTPHQGSEARFQNILRLLSDDGKTIHGAAGRVIFRTKDHVRDWRGSPLFPSREIRQPIVVKLGQRYEDWYQKVGSLYDNAGLNGVRMRAAGWAKGQALQWASSSLQAGLGFLVRLGIRRLNWTLDNQALESAIGVLRPYRGGARDEPIDQLFTKLKKQIGSSELSPVELEDVESDEDEDWRPNSELLEELLLEAVGLIKGNAGQAKWDAVCRLIDESGDEKIVLFAQPVETVTLIADILELRYGRRPSIIIGNQKEDERTTQVERFQSEDGPRFLVSSKAGGEGLNMQRARRLIHLDIPWNPMDLEQRVGRVHRFGSRKTIIVDTVVASGSREVDMYRIAREKLAMVAKHLEPEQFEVLFSRVMSLVPPKELEDILGCYTDLPAFNKYASSQIGRLVTEGFKSWSAFDAVYRKQTDEIKAANPGEAHWKDLGAFLLKYANAKTEDAAVFSSFEFNGEEIVAVDEQVPTLRLGDTVFSCGDTGGLRPIGKEGSVVEPLGLNIKPVQLALRHAFFGDKVSGAACLKISKNHNLTFLQSGESVILFFMRQKLRQEGGGWVEHEVSFHAFVESISGEFIELTAQERALLVRTVHNWSRVKQLINLKIDKRLLESERNLYEQLRRPEEFEIEMGIRNAVWPIGAVYLTH
jgi:superfamily II DNA or RNA helicase